MLEDYVTRRVVLNMGKRLVLVNFPVSCYPKRRKDRG